MDMLFRPEHQNLIDVFPYSVNSWNNCSSSWYNWRYGDQNNRSCNDCKTWNWRLHCESNDPPPFFLKYCFVFWIYIWELVVIKIKLDAGSHKPLIKGLKWGTERQHSWWLAWDSHPIRELRLPTSTTLSNVVVTIWSAILPIRCITKCRWDFFM